MEEILPDVYVDGAHNISAVEAFAESVPEDGRENIILFSAVQDKDYEKMAECLCRSRVAALYVITHIDGQPGGGCAEPGRHFQEIYGAAGYSERVSERSVRVCAEHPERAQDLLPWFSLSGGDDKGIGSGGDINAGF